MEPGDRLGSYEVLRELARGGMGVVYLARHRSTGAEVALKTLALGPSDAELEQRFEREAQVLARLRHPAIVPVHEASFGAPPYMVQAYMPGGTLAQRLHAGPLPTAEALGVVRRIGEALAYAHDQGVIHRDLKPGNVLFDERGLACLADFGLASLVGAQTLTGTDELLGTPAYMAPEQAEDAKRAGVAADVYALGALLYACLAGSGPFAHHKGAVQTLNAVLHEVPAPLRDRRPDAPAALETLCGLALAKQPSERPADARAFLAALAGDALPARGPSRASAAALAAAAAVGLGGVASWLASPTGTAPPTSAASPADVSPAVDADVDADAALVQALDALARDGTVSLAAREAAPAWLAAATDLGGVRARLGALPDSPDVLRLRAWAAVLDDDLDALADWDPPASAAAGRGWALLRQVAADLRALSREVSFADGYADEEQRARALARDAAHLGKTDPVGLAARAQVQRGLAWMVGLLGLRRIPYDERVAPLVSDSLALRDDGAGRPPLLAAAAYARSKHIKRESDYDLLEAQLDQAAEDPDRSPLGLHWRAAAEARWRYVARRLALLDPRGSRGLRERAVAQLGRLEGEYPDDRRILEISLAFDTLHDGWQGLRSSRGDVAIWGPRLPLAQGPLALHAAWIHVDALTHLLRGEPERAVARSAPLGSGRFDSPAERAIRHVVLAEAALLRTPRDLAAAAGHFDDAVAAGGETPPAEALLGRLHVRVLRGELEVEVALDDDDVDRAKRTIESVGCYWHHPEWFEATLRGTGWWPGQP